MNPIVLAFIISLTLGICVLGFFIGKNQCESQSGDKKCPDLPSKKYSCMLVPGGANYCDQQEDGKYDSIEECREICSAIPWREPEKRLPQPPNPDTGS